MEQPSNHEQAVEDHSAITPGDSSPVAENVKQDRRLSDEWGE